MSQPSQINFAELAKNAYYPESGEPQGPREALTALWQALFELDEWLFIASPKSIEAGSPYPYFAVVDNQGWCFAFTDSNLLHACAQKNGLVDKNGESHFIVMKTASAREWLQSLIGSEAHGVRFNEGPTGWFAPFENVEAIYQHIYPK